MDSDSKYAGFWIRLLALIIDGLIVGIPTWIVATVLGLGFSATQVLFLIAGITYYVYFLSSPWQATIGKRALNIYVVRAGDEGRLTQQEALKRYGVFAAASILMVLYMVVSGGPAAMVGLDESRLAEIQSKAMRGEMPSAADQEYLQNSLQAAQGAETPMMYNLLNLINLAWALALAFSVGLTKEKTGIHDMAVKTRALKGRTAATSFK